MIVVGIVSELRHDQGLYGMRNRDRHGHSEAIEIDRVAAAAAALLIPRFTISSYLLAQGIGAVALPPLIAAAKGAFNRQKLESHAALPAFADAQEAPPGRLPPGGAIVVPSALLFGRYPSKKDPVLYGLFKGRRQLVKVFSAEGGNVDLWILDAKTASERFSHHGGAGGQFSTGLYLPHPKDSRTLIPANQYSTILQEEVMEEWIRMFEALGAKSVFVCDSTKLNLTMKGKKAATGSIPEITAEMKLQAGRQRFREAVFAPGTFDPERALAGKKWAMDFPKIMTVYEGRSQGALQTFSETVKMNCDFGIDIGVLKQMGAGLEGGFEREYSLLLEFHQKPT